MSDVNFSSSLPELPAAKSANSGPLSAEHFEEIARAEERGEVLARTLRMASFNGWTLGLAAVLSILMGMFQFESTVLAIALAALAFNEFRGRNLLLAYDPGATRVLGWNQIGVMVLLVVYASWKLIIYKAGANPYEKEMTANPELVPMLEPILKMYATMTRALYMTMIAIGVLYQGGNAWYYFSRTKHLEAYLRETPGWVLKLLRTRGK